MKLIRSAMSRAQAESPYRDELGGFVDKTIDSTFELKTLLVSGPTGACAVRIAVRDKGILERKRAIHRYRQGEVVEVPPRTGAG